MSNPAAIGSIPSAGTNAAGANDLEALFNASEYFDLSAMSPPPPENPTLSMSFGSGGLGEASAPFDTLEGFAATMASNGGMSGMHLGQTGQGSSSMSGLNANGEMSNGNSGRNLGHGASSLDGMDFGKFDMGLSNGNLGSGGGETLAGEGMDTVSDGLRGGEAGQGL